MKGTLHHVSLVTRDLDRSKAFYQQKLVFEPIPRPAFPISGAWLREGSVELHLIAHPGGTTRQSPAIDPDDIHFAVRVENFDQTLAELRDAGFRDDAALDDPARIFVKRNSLAGYGQIYLCDPDHHVIEINAKVA